AVSKTSDKLSLSHMSVAIYDNGTQRQQTTEKAFQLPWETNNVIEYGSSASTIYGLSLGSSIQDFHRMTVTSAGVQVTGEFRLSTFANDFRFDNGLLYTDRGEVFNPDTGA